MTPDHAAAIARLYAQERAAWAAVVITGVSASTEAANSALDAWERANAARGEPKHPLTLGYDTVMEPFTP